MLRKLPLLLALCASFCVSGFSASAFAANEFTGPVSYATADRPLSVARADVDLDGDVDLVVCEVSARTVSIMNNNGRGIFSRGPVFAVSGQPVWVALGRIDGDSYPDVVVAEESSDRIQVRLNTRTGRFGAPSYYGVGQPSTVALSDVNGDGRNDLLATGQESDEVAVFRGDGAGRFGAKQDYPVQDMPRSLALGDLNGDGRTDVATANYYSDTISVLLNNGDGFAEARIVDADQRPFFVTVGDVNGDSTGDIVITNKQSDSIWTALNDGAARFAFAPWLSVDLDPTVASLADINADGRLDLFTASYSGNVVATFMGDGAGSFVPSTRYPIGAGPWSATVGDIDGDSRADIVTADCLSDTISVLHSNSGSAFTGIGLRGRTITCGSACTLTAKLAADGVSLPGRSVVFERKTATGWARVATKKTTGAGTASVRVKPRSNTTYRARFVGGTAYRSSAAQASVRVRAALSTPRSSSAVTRGRKFTMTGFLKPRHTAKRKSVKLYWYRRQNGRWVLRKTVWTTNRNYSSYTRFTASASLPLRGKWRVRAYHSDAGHAPRYSGYKYVTVK